MHDWLFSNEFAFVSIQNLLSCFGPLCLGGGNWVGLGQNQVRPNLGDPIIVDPYETCLMNESIFKTHTLPELNNPTRPNLIKILNIIKWLKLKLWNTQGEGKKYH